MYRKLLEYANLLMELTSEEEDLIFNYFHEIHFKSGEKILNRNTICNKIYFMNNGLTRNFYLNEKGVEVTRKFGQKNDFISNFPSFNNKIPSNETIEALEDSDLIYVTYDDFNFLIKKSSNFDKIFRLVLAQLQEYHVKQLEFLTCYTPLERLQQFKEKQPKLYQKLTNKVLASFLAIAPETCSRLKQKV